MLMTRMNAIIRNVLLVFAALLPIVNPFGMAPIFASMTLGYDDSVRRAVALRVAINGIVLLVASLFVGSYILEFFGVSLAAVQVGGGLVVTVAGWRILNQQDDLKEKQITPRRGSDFILSQAFYPLTLPLTVGPGSIAVALTLGSNIHSETHLQLIVSALAAVAGILLIGLTIFLTYWLSDRLERLLGPTGTSILVRLSAFIVVCIGIEILYNGLHDFYLQNLRSAQ
jgi:multiple antibiotic resistance protein